MEYDKKDVLEFIVAMISEFSKRHKITELDAFKYLRNFNGLDFIQRCYGSLHTDNFEYVLDDLSIICRRNGGQI